MKWYIFQSVQQLWQIATLKQQLRQVTGLLNTALDAVEVGAVEGVPLGPDVCVLAEGAVAGAGHVAQHAVVAQVAHAAVLLLVLQVGHAGGVVVDDDVVGALGGNSIALQNRRKIQHENLLIVKL